MTSQCLVQVQIKPSISSHNWTVYGFRENSLKYWFRIPSNIRDGIFAKNSYWIYAVNYFCKSLHLRCLTGSMIAFKISLRRGLEITSSCTCFNWYLLDFNLDWMLQWGWKASVFLLLKGNIVHFNCSCFL